MGLGAHRQRLTRVPHCNVDLRGVLSPILFGLQGARFLDAEACGRRIHALSSRRSLKIIEVVARDCLCLRGSHFIPSGIHRLRLKKPRGLTSRHRLAIMVKFRVNPAAVLAAKILKGKRLMNHTRLQMMTPNTDDSMNGCGGMIHRCKKRVPLQGTSCSHMKRSSRYVIPDPVESSTKVATCVQSSPPLSIPLCQDSHNEVF